MVVHGQVAESDQIAPWNVGMTVPNGRINSPSRLTDDGETLRHGELDHVARQPVVQADTVQKPDYLAAGK